MNSPRAGIMLDTNWLQTFKELFKLSKWWNCWLLGCSIHGEMGFETAKLLGRKSANKLIHSLWNFEFFYPASYFWHKFLGKVNRAMPFSCSEMKFCSLIRNWITYANEANIANTDSPSRTGLLVSRAKKWCVLPRDCFTKPALSPSNLESRRWRQLLQWQRQWWQQLNPSELSSAASSTSQYTVNHPRMRHSQAGTGDIERNLDPSDSCYSYQRLQPRWQIRWNICSALWRWESSTQACTHICTNQL